MTPYGSFQTIALFPSALGTGTVPWTDGILPATSSAYRQQGERWNPSPKIPTPLFRPSCSFPIHDLASQRSVPPWGIYLALMLVWSSSNYWKLSVQTQRQLMNLPRGARWIVKIDSRDWRMDSEGGVEEYVFIVDDWRYFKRAVLRHNEQLNLFVI